MKLTTITILASDSDADSAQRTYQKGEPDAVWQAFQALMTNPDNVLTFGLAPTAEKPSCFHGNKIGPVGCEVPLARVIGAWRWIVCLDCGAWKRWDNDETPIDNCKAAEHIEWVLPNKLATLRTQLAQLAAMRSAGQALCDKLDAALPKIDDMCVLEHIHGRPYDGPNLSQELTALKELLRADRLSAPKPDNSTGGLGQDGLPNQLEGDASSPPKLEQG